MIIKAAKTNIFNISRRIMWLLFQIKMKSSHDRLAQIKRDQKTTFYTLRNNFFEIYNNLKKYNIDQFTTPKWESSETKLEKLLLPHPPFSFLETERIRKTMFAFAGGKRLRTELTFLEKKISRNKLMALLQEDYVGNPLLLNSTYLTSQNSIDHLYHFIRFSDKTQCNLEQIDTIVEWGGGYGNMAKIFNRLKATPSTYIIIDIPIVSCLQWLYLATILGKENVHLLQNTEDTLHANKINLVPLCFMDLHKISADLFISTWGLSESSRYSQDYVENCKWFNSKHILLGYQDSNQSFPDADRVGKLAAGIGAVIEDIEFLPRHHYAFR